MSKLFACCKHRVCCPHNVCVAWASQWWYDDASWTWWCSDDGYEWFETDQIDKIQSGKLDYKMYFRKAESGFNVDQFATFDVPFKFHDRVQKVIDVFRSDGQTTPAQPPTQQPHTKTAY